MTALVLDKTDYAVLNVVALKKMATPQVVAAAAGVGAENVAKILAGLTDQGLVVIAAGSALPSDEAERALRTAAAEHYATVRADQGIAELVDRFENINALFLTTMSAWQQIDVGGRKVANDHSDSAYDDKIITRLHKLITRLEPLLAALAEHDARFGIYLSRFAAAVEAIDQGRHDLVTSPSLDSVHNIWFEFHEDLLRTLGRERVE